ncbi:hypothetical protein K0M31_010529 [Melipona bicolor]|uniref:Uncharacterized protein n=1 Tax=Melipona bicolor TaxID=60889 RepID=A0AA40KI71_9HYME|nr:hypothetical protein K0M31_010529 [Melipona bicolor]
MYHANPSRRTREKRSRNELPVMSILLWQWTELVMAQWKKEPRWLTIAFTINCNFSHLEATSVLLPSTTTVRATSSWKVYHRRPLDATEIKATNWTIPVSLTFTEESRDLTEQIHRAAHAMHVRTQPDAVTIRYRFGSARRHAFRLHEAFMLIARDLR